jgi:hypothetical protein
MCEYVEYVILIYDDKLSFWWLYKSFRIDDNLFN